MIPIVATGPSCFTHSCEEAYFNPSKTEEKQRERESAGERWALEAQEILSALAVEEAHILRAMLSSILSVFLVISSPEVDNKE